MAVLFKTLSGTIPANTNEITFTDSIINDNTIVEAYYTNNDVYTVETWQNGTTIGIVVSDHDVPVSIKVTLNNVNSFEPYDDTEVLSQLSSLSDDVSGLDGRLDNAEDDIDNLENDVDSLETALTGKQDVLTAGDGITIENNVISVSSLNNYSYDEQEIGVWLDGNKIYRKCFDLETDVVIASTAWYANIVSITGIDKIVNCFGQYSGGTFYPLMAYHVNEAVNALACRDNNSASVRYFVIEYTKTS